MMEKQIDNSDLFPSQLAALCWHLQSIPALAQQAQLPGLLRAPLLDGPAASPASPSNKPAKEGFWGRINPLARKKWVKRQTDPINDRLSELDEVNAKNAQRHSGRGCQGSGRHSPGAVHRRCRQPDSHRRGRQAQQASDTCPGRGQPRGSVELHRQRPRPVPSGHRSRDYLLWRPAGSVDCGPQATGRIGGRHHRPHGYILEVEAHSPAAGSVGIQNSQRLAEVVKRYLVTEHQIPVYRLHSVALGNAQITSAGDETTKPVRTSSVHIRLMENSLAAQGAAPPDGAVSSTGAERP